MGIFWARNYNVRIVYASASEVYMPCAGTRSSRRSCCAAWSRTAATCCPAPRPRCCATWRARRGPRATCRPRRACCTTSAPSPTCCSTCATTRSTSWTSSSSCELHQQSLPIDQCNTVLLIITSQLCQQGDMTWLNTAAGTSIAITINNNPHKIKWVELRSLMIYRISSSLKKITIWQTSMNFSWHIYLKSPIEE